MLDKRYHVYLSLAGDFMQTERRLVQQALASIGCFAWGVEQRSPLTRKLAIRQIEDCDYVLMLLSEHYGDQAMTGYSYQQLEFEYALSQEKPILILMTQALYQGQINTQQTAGQQNLQQQFLSQIMQQPHIICYREQRDLELNARYHMQQLLQSHPVVGWVRPQFLQTLQDEIDSLQQKIQQLELTRQGSLAEPARVAATSLHHSMLIEYRIHAYQDGNFEELKLQRHLSWGQLLQIVAVTFQHPTPEEHFSRCLNDYFNETGLADAKQLMPRAHAVARAQVHIRSLHHVKTHLQQHEWVVPTQRDERQRLLWQVTEYAQKILSQSNGLHAAMV